MGFSKEFAGGFYINGGESIVGSGRGARRCPICGERILKTEHGMIVKWKSQYPRHFHQKCFKEVCEFFLKKTTV